MKILRFKGTPYENGKASGNFFKKVIQQSMPFYENLLKNLEIKCLDDQGLEAGSLKML